jgi:two-component system response regulator CssR
MYTIYLVEDEERLRKLLVMYLEKEGYLTRSFASAEAAFDYLTDSVSLWILDIKLPGADGFELIKRIKEINDDVPVIFASARDSEMDRIMGLRFGSDDYVTKPFSVQELILRIEKLLKRVYKTDTTLIQYASYAVDLRKRTVYECEVEIKLTTREFDLLALLIKNINKAYSRTEILNYIWGGSTENSDRVVDDTIRRLRKKMCNMKLETIYGIGYRLL